MYNLSKKIRSAGQFIMQNLVNTGIRAKLTEIWSYLEFQTSIITKKKMLPWSWRQALPLAFLCENRQVWGLDRVTMHQFVTDSCETSHMY